MKTYEVDGGNLITTIQIRTDKIKECQNIHDDKNVLYHWIKDNFDDKAELKENKFDGFSIQFIYHGTKTGLFVLDQTERGKMSRLTLMTPDLELGKQYYDEIRKAIHIGKEYTTK